MDKERNSNFELLRIVSMFFIVLYHTIVHGNVINNCNNEGLKFIFEIMVLISIVHVNSFVLVSGYFQSKSKFKQSKLWSIISANVFYKIAIVFVLSLLGIRTFTKVEIFRAMFPLNLHEYWFIGNYLILYCLSPFINMFIESLDKKNYKKLLIVLFVIFSIIPYLTGNRAVDNTGFTLYNFIYLYLIGGYLRLYPIEKCYIFKKMSRELLQIVLIFIFFSCVIVNYSFSTTATTLLNTNSIFNELADWITFMTKNYSNPFIMIQTVAYFSFFGTLKIKSKIINWLSKLTFGIYLIHDNNYIRANLYNWLKVNRQGISSYKCVIYIIVISLFIYIICSIIEIIRQVIFKLVSKMKLSKKIRKDYYELVNKISMRS